MKIQYIKGKNICDVISIEQKNENIVQVNGQFLVQEYGFMASEDDETFNIDYSKYRTIYRVTDEYVQFSNNGNVYTGSDEFDQPEPTFDEVLNNKISELSSICKEKIESGLDINGYQYSYKYDDQVNLDKIVNLVKETGLPLGYHANGQGCKEHSAEELIDIYMKLAMNQYSQQTHFNQTKMYLESLEESDDNKELISNYEYDTPLEGEYLENYNHMMLLYENQVKALAGVE